MSKSRNDRIDATFRICLGAILSNKKSGHVDKQNIKEVEALINGCYKLALKAENIRGNYINEELSADEISPQMWTMQETKSF